MPYVGPVKRSLVRTASFTLFPLLAITQDDATERDALPRRTFLRREKVVTRAFATTKSSPIPRSPALPACNGRIVAKSPCCIFIETTDGKRFSIGGPGATRAVSLFINTLRVGETYRFPDAWREYLKKQPER